MVQIIVLAVAGFLSAQAQSPGLRIVVLEGEGAVNIVQQGRLNWQTQSQTTAASGPFTGTGSITIPVTLQR